MLKLILLIPIFPLLGFLINSLLKKYISRKTSGVISSMAVLFSFIIVFILFLSQKNPITINLANWISAGSLNIPIEFLIDSLSLTMMLIVTGIGFLIHVYSIGYMHDDERIHTFFAYLNLFIFFMLLLVMGANYLILFIGWEGVGLCSYLLIGFWFKNHDFNNAARKAFVMNRIGDLGFLLGIILIYVTFGSVSFSKVLSASPGFISGNSSVSLITILLLIGALGKSAQIPLYTWLPDAMAGPTPVSALIHAATMVTAGIYMIARSGILYAYSEFTMNLIVVIGLSTAIVAATIALFQNDIKKVLAYSTISQLGYMFLALGLGAFSTAIFHVTMHAFFKALLFLGAGSVIHSLHGEQDIRNMGGLKKYLPFTFITFFIATLAISGIPPFSGFFSKDEILAKAFEQNTWLWLIGLLGALLTCFYMFRLFYLTFYGEFRGNKMQKRTVSGVEPLRIHESPKTMTIPLVILAVLSFAGGFINIPEIFGGSASFTNYLKPSLNGRFDHTALSHGTEWSILITSVILIVAVVFYAFYKFVTRQSLPIEENNMNFFQKLAYKKYYMDEIYNALFVKPYNWISEKLLVSIEKWIIDNFVNGIGNLSFVFGKSVRRIQAGSISVYMFAMIAGILLIIVLNMYFR